MNIADDIINGNYGKKNNKKSLADQIIDGTYNNSQKQDTMSTGPSTPFEWPVKQQFGSTPLPTATINPINTNTFTNSDILNHKKDLELLEKQNEGKEKQKGDTLLKASKNILKIPENFKDGYQLGDISKTIGSTVADVGVTVGKGAFSAIESLADFGQYAIAQGADLLGAKGFAEAVRENARYNSADTIFSPAQELYDKNSVAGDTTKQLAQGVGYVLGIGATGGVLPKGTQSINLGKLPGVSKLGKVGEIASNFNLPTTSLVSGMGNSMTEAYNNGATDGEAWGYGAISGLSEAFSESLFGGLGNTFKKAYGGGALDDVVVNKLTQNIQNRSLKILAQSGLKATGEGVEEIVSGLGSAIGKKLTYMNEEELAQLINDENLMDQFIMGTLTSMVVQTPSTYSSMKSGTDYVPSIESNNIQKNNISNEQVSNLNQQNSILNGNEPTNYENKNIQQNNNVNELFSKQIDEVMNGTYPKRDMLTVNQNTPKILQDIGLKDLPITITQKHLYTMTHSKGKYADANYHNIPIDIVKQLPSALEHPLNILKSNTKENSIVVVTELADSNDDIIVASIAIDGKGTIQDVRIDTNVMTSAYGKSGNYDYFMQDNIKKGNLLYDIDEGIINTIDRNVQKKSDVRDRLQLSMRDSDSATISDTPKNISPIDIDNIPQSNNNVKLDTLSKYSMQESKNNTQGLESGSFFVNKKDVNNANEIISNDNVLKVKSENIAQELNNKSYLNIPDGKELRRWSETSTSSELLKDFVAIEDLDIDKITYTPISNKKTLEKAQNKVSNMTYEEGLNYINAKMNDSKVDLTDLAVIDQLLVQAKQKGDYKIATELIMDKTILGTELGQMVQQFSMIGKTTPEGQLQMYQKIIKRAKATGDKSFEGVEITPEMVETVLKTYKDDGTYTQEDLDANMEVFKKQIVEQMKSTKADKINGWRYLSMLGNPKTHIRNVVSNIAMSGTMKVKNAMARTLESTFIHDKSKRTKTWKTASGDVKKFARESAMELKSVIQGESKYGTTNQLKMEKKVFDNKILEKISNFNSNALSVEDWIFSKNAYINSLQEYLTAKDIKTTEQINNNKELVEQAKLYAIEQAEIATFRQYSKIASYISKVENTNSVSKVAVGAMLPFKKTPINVAKTGVKYSPLGLIKTIGYDSVQLKNGNINASQFVDNMAQGITGTSLMLLGYSLAKAGFITGDSDDDKESKYDTQLGNQGYALKLGNKTYSLSWLSPVAMPFLMGANVYTELEDKEGWDANIVIDTLAKTMDPISEMSFVSSLTDALSSYNQGSMQMLSSMAQNTASNYALQFIPTLFSQIAGTFDDKVRSTSADRTSSFKFGNKLMKQAMYKIPGLRNQLPVATDVWGNDKKQSDNIIDRAYRNFISPYTRKEITSTSLDDELKKVYRETGNTSVIPGIPQGYLVYKDQNYNMNSQEYADFKKTYGNTAYQVLSDIIKSDSYKNSEVKENMIEDAYIYAKELAKKGYFNSKGIEYESKNQKWVQEIENKIAPDKYISFKKNDIDLIKGDKDADGNTIKGTNTGKKAYKIFNNSSLSSSEKDFLLTDISTSDNPVKLSILKKLDNDETVFKYYYGLSQKDTFNNIVLNGNLDQKTYINVKEYISQMKDKYPGTENSKQKRKAIFNYINSQKIDKHQKIMLYGASGYGISDYKNDMFNYINSLNLTKKEKENLYYYFYPKKGSGVSASK